MVTDSNRRVISLHDYLPYGEEIYAGQAGRANPFGAPDGTRQRFTGQERDGETTPHLDYFQARYYSAAQGRFLSPDPENAGSDPGDPQSWNGYTNAPVFTVYAMRNSIAHERSNSAIPLIIRTNAHTLLSETFSPKTVTPKVNAVIASSPNTRT